MNSPFVRADGVFLGRDDGDVGGKWIVAFARGSDCPRGLPGTAKTRDSSKIGRAKPNSPPNTPSSPPLGSPQRLLSRHIPRQLQIACQPLGTRRLADGPLSARLVDRWANGVRRKLRKQTRQGAVALRSADRVGFCKRCGLRIPAELRLSFEKVKKKRFPLRGKTLYGAARLCLWQRILFI
jgi:hypothetical protein